MHIVYTYSAVYYIVEPLYQDTGHTLSGHPLSGHTLSGHPLSGHTLSGHALSGHALSGHTLSGHALSGHTISGHLLKFHICILNNLRNEDTSLFRILYSSQAQLER